jgi:hypothetical protein
MVMWMKERMNGFNIVESATEGHMAGCGWTELAAAEQVGTEASEAAEGGKRKAKVDR